MGKWVALLRGVNVGGHARVPMPELRQVLAGAGLADVRTYIQSGNAIFRSEPEPVVAELEALLASRFGFPIAVMVRSAENMAAVVEGNPFDHDPTKVHVGFLAAPAPPGCLDDLPADTFGEDRAVLSSTEIYFHLPEGMGRTKLPDYVGRRAKVPMTVRNWRTVVTLAEMAAG